MNSIKMLIALFATVITAQSAFAAEWDCDPIKTEMKCEAKYELQSSYGTGELIQGPVETAQVENLEMEPFDPGICVNSLALFTYAGRFIATYYHRDNSFAAFVYSDGQTTRASDYEKVDPRIGWKFSMKSPFKGIVDTIHFTCTFVDKAEQTATVK